MKLMRFASRHGLFSAGGATVLTSLYTRSRYPSDELGLGLGKVCRAAPSNCNQLIPRLLSPSFHDLIPMTDLLNTIPDFPTNSYTHLLPSLERNLITTTDLLTLDALEVARRAQLPLLDVRRLASHVVAILQSRLGLKTHDASSYPHAGDGHADSASLRKTGKEATTRSNPISTLDPSIDAALGGGIPTGYITEITGEGYQTETSDPLYTKG